MTTDKKKIVVIGGGTGTYVLLSGLKSYADTLDITAIVTMADSGGSTGRLRDEFGQLPVGDARMALCALAADVDQESSLLRELFLYRFAKGEGLQGHNFGNLLLTALTDILGDTSQAIETASQILRVNGSVLPVTEGNVQLAATYSSGTMVVGEHDIDVPSKDRHYARIVDLTVTPAATINPKARAAILAADLIVLGPGDLYTSILASLIVGGVKEALCESKAAVVFVCNLMSRLGQTVGMHAADYLDEIERYAGRRPEHMIYNQTEFAESLLAKYQHEGMHPVLCTETDPATNVQFADVVSTEAYVSTAGDVLERSLIRHDSEKLARALLKLIEVY